MKIKISKKDRVNRFRVLMKKYQKQALKIALEIEKNQRNQKEVPFNLLQILHNKVKQMQLKIINQPL